MKIVARFIGKCTRLCNPPEVSYTILKNVDTGESKETTAVTEMLIEKNIGQGDDFEIIISQDDAGKCSAEIRKLEPKEQEPMGDGI